MEARAELKYARISSRKVKIVIDLIKGKPAKEAVAILKYTNKAAAPIVGKLLKSAIANATNNHNMDETKLYVAEAYANQAPSFKRVSFRGRGGVDTIIKRNCHITIVLDTLNK